MDDAPVIVLSAVGEERQKIAALDAGADDYVTKPFSVDELLARLRAVLRRRAPDAASRCSRSGDCASTCRSAPSRCDGERVKLTPARVRLLRVLAQNQGKLLTHRMLLREVWGPAYQVEAHYLHVYISHLRKKIEPDPTSPRYLLTEPGAGYRLVEPVRRQTFRPQDPGVFRLPLTPAAYFLSACTTSRSSQSPPRASLHLRLLLRPWSAI